MICLALGRVSYQQELTSEVRPILHETSAGCFRRPGRAALQPSLAASCSDGGVSSQPYPADRVQMDIKNTHIPNQLYFGGKNLIGIEEEDS